MPLLTDIEQDAQKVATWLSNTEKKITKASPSATAGLALLLGAAATAVGNTSAAASAEGLNISLDVTAATSIKALWPDVKNLAADLGIKL
jgi:hypothetical protein